MKIRYSFVSNSSTANFVIVGYKTKENLYKEENGEIFEPEVIDLPNGDKIESIYVEQKDAMYITGIILQNGNCDDYGLDNMEFTPEEIEAKIKLVAKHTKVEKKNIKLYMGCRPA